MTDDRAKLNELRDDVSAWQAEMAETIQAEPGGCGDHHCFVSELADASRLLQRLIDWIDAHAASEGDRRD